ncbi:unnamed protein product [Colias eurytheme]|nr:unnamed protein product [Colias eurytheme]
MFFLEASNQSRSIVGRLSSRSGSSTDERRTHSLNKSAKRGRGRSSSTGAYTSSTSTSKDLAGKVIEALRKEDFLPPSVAKGH